MLCTWARDHGINGTGIDMSQLFTAQAKQRAEELGVSERVHFIHNDAAGYVTDEKCDVAACVGATWIAGGFAGSVELLAKSLKPGGMILIGEPWWRKIPATEEIAQACGVSSKADFLTFLGSSLLSTNSAMTLWKWYWRTRRAGTDMKQRNG